MEGSNTHTQKKKRKAVVDRSFYGQRLGRESVRQPAALRRLSADHRQLPARKVLPYFATHSHTRPSLPILHTHTHTRQVFQRHTHTPAGGRGLETTHFSFSLSLSLSLSVVLFGVVVVAVHWALGFSSRPINSGPCETAYLKETLSPEQNDDGEDDIDDDDDDDDESRKNQRRRRRRRRRRAKWRRSFACRNAFRFLSRRRRRRR